jgi:aminoacyl tRNA synthase complex-interacting multifunctional protein 1
MTKTSALELIDDAIAELEARLGSAAIITTENKTSNTKNKKPTKKQETSNNHASSPPPPPEEQPDICKLEFKVGVITNVWVHPTADKLYCEDIDCGEDEVRQIASGLRPHFTLEQMKGQRVLVVSNLKAKNLVGFKSHGMVLCAATVMDEKGELVEFVEPPLEAPIGETVTFQGLPAPQPVSAAQVEKKKVFQACMEGMKTTQDCQAAWNGHVFMTTKGPCMVKSIRNGVLR